IYDRVAQSDLGVTYRAYRAADKCASSIKVICPRWVQDKSDRARLISEVERWANLGDRRVVPSSPLELDAGELALVSCWSGPRSLAAWVRAGWRVAPSTAGWLVGELIQLLARADAHGLVHGDLRPSNMILDNRGRVRVTDCGVRYAIPSACLR